MNHAKRNPGIPKRPNPQKNAKVVLVRTIGRLPGDAVSGIIVGCRRGPAVARRPTRVWGYNHRSGLGGRAADNAACDTADRRADRPADHCACNGAAGRAGHNAVAVREG